MANKINIEFAAKGHPGVIQAVKSLNKQVSLLAQNNRILMGASGPLTAAQKKSAAAFLEQQRAARNTAGTLSVLRSKMLLASFGAGLLSASLLKLANMAGDAEEQMAKASVVFGASTDAVLEFANTTSDATGRSRFSLIQMAASVQDILVPMGMLRHEAAELSQEIVKTAIDVASFNNVSESDAMRDFNSALVGNHETVRKYGIVISEARMQQVALDKGIISTGESLSDQDKILARLAILQMDSSDAMGDAERTADSYANTMKALSAEFEVFSIELGQQIMPVVKALAQVMISLLENAFNPVFVRRLVTVMLALTTQMSLARLQAVKLSKVMKTLGASFTTARKAALRFLKILLIFEAMGKVFDLIFPSKDITDTSAQGINDITQALKNYDEQLKSLTLSQLNEELDTLRSKLDLQEEFEVLRSNKELLATLPRFNPPPGGLSQLYVQIDTTVKNLEERLKNVKQLTGPELAFLKEQFSIVSQKILQASGATIDYSKAQSKVISEIESLNKQLRIYDDTLSTSIADQRLANEAMDRYGIDINNVLPAQEALVEELKEYIKLEGELAGQNEIAKIQGKIDALNGQTAAQAFLNQQAAKGVAISTEDAQTIKDLNDLYEKEKEHLELLAEEKIILNDLMSEGQNKELAEINSKIQLLETIAEEIGLTNELAIAIDNLKNKKEQVEDLDGKTHKLSLFRNQAEKDSTLMLIDATAALSASHKQGALVSARLSQLSAIINTYEAFTDLLNQPVKAAAVLVQGLAAVAQIEVALSQMGGSGGSSAGNNPQQAAYGMQFGGLVGGQRHAQGGTMINAEQGEFVINRRAVNAIGLETLNEMNRRGESGTNSINVNVSGNVMTQDFVEGELAEAIKEAARRGSDFGLS